MKTLKGAAKSKTIWLSALLSFLYPILEALPQAKAFLGEHYGPALCLLGAFVGLLRYLTTQSLEAKADA